MRRPKARYSELGFTAVAAFMISFGIVYIWPEPELDVSPVWCKPTPTPTPHGYPAARLGHFQPLSGDRLGGLPPSFERHGK